MDEKQWLADRAVMGFTVAGGRIVEIDAIADPERVRGLAAAVLAGDPPASVDPPAGPQQGDHLA